MMERAKHSLLALLAVFVLVLIYGGIMALPLRLAIALGDWADPVGVIYQDGFYITTSHVTGRPLMFTDDQIQIRRRYGNFDIKNKEVHYYQHNALFLTSCRLERRIMIPPPKLAVISLSEGYAVVAFPKGLQPVRRGEAEAVKMYTDFLARQMARDGKKPQDYWAYQWKPGTDHGDGRLLHVIWQ